MSLVFFDDFDTLDTDVWLRENPWHQANVNNSYYQVADSVLTMTIEPGQTLDHTELVTLGGGRAGAEPYYPNALGWQEGYFEARLRYTNEQFCYPAFWMLSLEHANTWPTGDQCPLLRCEWDIMENSVGGTHANDVAWMTAHRNNLEGLCGEAKTLANVSRDLSATMDLSDWHTWGGKWVDGTLTQYIDDVPILTLSAPDSFNQPMYLLLFIAIRPGGALAQYTMDVDWVKVWQ